MQYRDTPNDLGERRLQRHARIYHLWALGVGAVISGDFFGWNLGLPAGGFGGLMAALVVMTVLYTCLCLSLAELSPALPYAGGAYSFARIALGPWPGYLTGLAESIEYIFTPAVIVVGIGGYLGSIFGTRTSAAPVWWLGCYVVFLILNIAGVAASFAVTVLITLCALLVLALFCLAAIPHFDLQRWAIEGRGWLPTGVTGIFQSLPFALWVYLGIEQLPLAAEEAKEPARSMPASILAALGTLVVFAFAVLVLNSGIAPGATAVGKASDPLLLGFRTVFGDSLLTRMFGLVACSGLIASFHGTMYGYGRQVYSLARAGYFPYWLSGTHRKRKTPHRALIVGAVLGYLAALAIHLLPQQSPVAGVLLNMAVFGAVLAYVLQMASFIALRLRHPELPRPFLSPLGIPGAAVAIVISSVTLASLFLHPDYRPGVWGMLAWFCGGLLYFALYSRKRIIRSPEEELALEMAQRREAITATEH